MPPPLARPIGAPPDPHQLIQEAADKIRSAETFRIDVTETGPDYTLYTEYATVFFRRAVAQYVSPGIMQATIRVIAAGLPLEIEVFSEGAEQWYRAIWTGNLWLKQAFAPGFNPTTLIAEETGFQAALDALIDLTYMGEGELENGTPVHMLAATAEGPDGGLARIAYLDSEVVSESANPELAALIRRRQALEQKAEEHKELKGVMPDAEWQAQFEKLMLELAQVSAEIRKKS